MEEMGHENIQRKSEIMMVFFIWEEVFNKFYTFFLDQEMKLKKKDFFWFQNKK